MSWLTNWTYRKSHNIAAATGAGTDYQKRIRVNYSNTEFRCTELEDVTAWYKGAGEFYMRTLFYGVGLYWAFYTDGTNIVYKTSRDGLIWSTKIALRTGTNLTAFAIFWDDPYLHYIFGPDAGDGKTYYRRGTPNTDGTISWTSAEVEIHDHNGSMASMAVDSDGKLWYVYCKNPPLDFYVTKNDAVDGSWSHADGYPLKLATSKGERTEGSLVALTNGKLYAAYSYLEEGETNPSVVYGKLFDGETWGSEETISEESLTYIAGCGVSVDAIGDDVYCVYQVEAVEDKARIMFNKRTHGVGWGEEEQVSDDLPEGISPKSAAGPAITFNPDTDELWVFYADHSTNKIYSRKRTNGSWEDEEVLCDLTGIHNMDLFCVNAFRRPWDGYPAIKFDTNLSTTNKVWWISCISDSNPGENVFLNGKCKTDFSDIRFTDNDGETLLDYWLQEKVDSDYAIFWVKVNDDLSTETQSIYIYYGNAEAIYPIGDDQDEMDATFLFADHFYGDALDVDKWDEVGSPVVSIADSICTVSNEGSGWKGIGSDDLFGAYSIAWMSKKQFPAANYTSGGMCDSVSGLGDSMHFSRDAITFRTKTYNDSSGSNEIITTIDTAHHIFEITWKDGECKFYVDDILESTLDSNIPDEALNVWIASYNGQSQDSDWVAVRKFVDPEPEHDIWSIEDIDSLRGSIVATSGVIGSLTIEDYIELIGSTTATSEATGSLSSEDTLIGSITETSSITGSLSSEDGLSGSIIETSGITGTIVKFVTLSNGPVWLGIDSSHLDSYCGHGDNQPCANALDGTGPWYHWVEGGEADEHFVILDLGASFIVSEVRSRSMTSMDPTNVDIYVSDDKEDWGEAVATGISDWQDTGEWQAANVNDKRGRYVLIDIQDVEGSPASGQLQYGDSDPPFKILDVFGVLADQALSNITGSLDSQQGFVSSITATSDVTGSLSSLDKLIGSIAEISGVTGSLTILVEIELIGTSSGISDIIGSLSSEDELIGSITETSSVTGSLDFIGEILELVGSIVETSSVIGSFDRQSRLCSSLTAFSNIIGCLCCEDSLIGSIIETSGAIGFLSSIDQLIGSGICGISSAGEVSVIRTLIGSITGISDVFGAITFIPMGFYESLANQITTYLQNIADLNGLLVRYDNDSRETPAENLWCEASVDFGNSEKSDLGIESFRNTGNLNIRIKNSIGLGTGELYATADIMAEAFRRKNLNRILFEVPRIRNNKRIKDDYQLSVICPFFTDKLGK